MCDCASGFSGPNCGSECIVWGIRIYIFPGCSVLDVYFSACITVEA